MNLGKKIRLSRIINPKSKKTIIVPMDHHGTTIPPIDGIQDPQKLIKNLCDGGVDSILAHTGTLLHGLKEVNPNCGYILHMSLSTNISPNPNQKLIVNTIKHALSIGVDGVSVQVNLGNEFENQMLQDLSLISNKCMRYGLPLIGMIYVRGNDKDEKDPELIKHSARLVSELGADIVKIPYTGNVHTMEKVAKSTQIPVVIAGGSKISDIEALKMTESAIKAGCCGLSMGRNIFQRKNPSKFIKALRSIVHQGKSLDFAKKYLD